MGIYAVSSPLIRYEKDCIKILCAIEQYNTASEEEAISKFKLDVSKNLPEYSIHGNPVSLKIKDREKIIMGYRYPNGELILKSRIEEEDWYPEYLLMEEVANRLPYAKFEDPGHILSLYIKASQERNRVDFVNPNAITWAVYLTEKHNNKISKENI